MSRPSFGIYPFPQVAPYGALVDRVRRAEAMGLDSIWVADQTPMAYPRIIHFEAWSLLGALARETTRIRLGTLVTPVILRHPLLLAMSVSTVDHASNGRAVLGIGAGGAREDLAGVGLEELNPSELIDRLEEQLVIVDALLRGETVTREAGPYRTRDAVIERPVQRPRPPLLVAAQGPRALRIAARHADIWNSLGGQPIDGNRLTLEEAVAATRRQVELIEEACREQERDPASLRRSVFAWRAGALSSADAFMEWVERYRELGFDDFVLGWPATPEREVVLERVVAEIIPGLRGE